jgi:hypothetical protein
LLANFGMVKRLGQNWECLPKMSVANAKMKTQNEKENKMTLEQKMRYKELMWIAKDGDYMSNAEYEELGMLIKLNGYK